MKLIPFETRHAIFLCPNAIDPLARGMEEHAVYRAASDAAYTGIDADGNIVCAFGIRVRKPGVADVWSIFNQRVKTHKKSTFRMLVTMLGVLIKTFELKKLRSESRIGFVESQRMLEHLGFIRQHRNMINGKYYFYKRGA
jgi:hypothetical protein